MRYIASEVLAMLYSAARPPRANYPKHPYTPRALPEPRPIPRSTLHPSTRAGPRARRAAWPKHDAEAVVAQSGLRLPQKRREVALVPAVQLTAALPPPPEDGVRASRASKPF